MLHLVNKKGVARLAGYPQGTKKGSRAPRLPLDGHKKKQEFPYVSEALLPVIVSLVVFIRLPEEARLILSIRVSFALFFTLALCPFKPLYGSPQSAGTTACELIHKPA